MPEAKGAHVLKREQGVRHLGFLQADDIGRCVLAQPGKQRHPQAEGIDIPGDDTHIGCIADPWQADKNIFFSTRRGAGRKQERMAKGG
ncbi:hypothetical protein AA15237_3096 [Komagataeibacter xylinus NBRC 15237]|nr:hypothetical protein AA15237_3096 [Komagataeibacter xylinus NBRC 15237]